MPRHPRYRAAACGAILTWSDEEDQDRPFLFAVPGRRYRRTASVAESRPGPVQQRHWPMSSSQMRVNAFAAQRAAVPGQCVSVRRWRATRRPVSAGALEDCSAEASMSTYDAMSAPQPVADLAQAVVAPQPDAAAGPALPAGLPTAALAVGGLALAAYAVKRVFDTPSRTYDQNVGQEYDAWTDEGVLECEPGAPGGRPACVGQLGGLGAAGRGPCLGGAASAGAPALSNPSIRASPTARHRTDAAATTLGIAAMCFWPARACQPSPQPPPTRPIEPAHLRPCSPHPPTPPPPHPHPPTHPSTLTPTHSLIHNTHADYWGEHIHLGYYNDEERRRGYKKKDFIQAKYDFVEEMLKWSGAQVCGGSVCVVVGG